jgi:hypothetical protein
MVPPALRLLPLLTGHVATKANFDIELLRCANSVGLLLLASALIAVLGRWRYRGQDGRWLDNEAVDVITDLPNSAVASMCSRIMGSAQPERTEFDREHHRSQREQCSLKSVQWPARRTVLRMIPRATRSEMEPRIGSSLNEVDFSLLLTVQIASAAGLRWTLSSQSLNAASRILTATRGDDLAAGGRAWAWIGAGPGHLTSRPRSDIADGASRA